MLVIGGYRSSPVLNGIALKLVDLQRYAPNNRADLAKFEPGDRVVVHSLLIGIGG